MSSGSVDWALKYVLDEGAVDVEGTGEGSAMLVVYSGLVLLLIDSMGVKRPYI